MYRALLLFAAALVMSCAGCVGKLKVDWNGSLDPAIIPVLPGLIADDGERPVEGPVPVIGHPVPSVPPEEPPG